MFVGPDPTPLRYEALQHHTGARRRAGLLLPGLMVALLAGITTASPAGSLSQSSAATPVSTVGPASGTTSGLAWRSSPIALTPQGGTLVVVNPDSDSVSLVNTATLAVTAEIPVGRTPQTVSLDPEGHRAYVTIRGEDALSVIDLATARVTARLATGAEPFGVVAGPGGRVYVSNYTSDTVSVLNVTTGRTDATVSVPARPRGLALSPDDTRLYVTHFLSGELTVIDTTSLAVATTLSTGRDRNWSQSVLIDAARGRAYLPQTRSNNTHPTPLYDSFFFPVVAVVDLAAATALPRERIALDVSDRPVNLPLDAVLTPGGKLYVVNAGSNDLSVIDVAGGFNLGVAHIPVGDNPRGIALAPDAARAYVNNTLRGSVTIIDTRTDRVVGEVTVTRIPLPDSVLNGKRLFNSADRREMSRGQWMSCASCHFDGGFDARTWPTPDGPRNTPFLGGAARTPPYHRSGNFDELQDAEIFIRMAMGGTGLIRGPVNCTPACDQAPPNAGLSPDLDDLAAYLHTLPYPVTPSVPIDPATAALQARGEQLFSSASTGCLSCHALPDYTNGRLYDVGTGNGLGERAGPVFDTPALRGVWRTAPYLHDGRTATLEDVLTTANPDDRHGRTSHLTPDEVAAMVAFLRSR